jgi:hypothetical protein
MIQEVCRNVNFASLQSVGTCFLANAFWGNATLGGIAILFLFMGYLFRYNFPVAMFFPIVNMLFYGLWLITGDALWLGLLLLGFIVSGVIMSIGLLGSVNR